MLLYKKNIHTFGNDQHVTQDLIHVIPHIHFSRAYRRLICIHLRHTIAQTRKYLNATLASNRKRSFFNIITLISFHQTGC